MDDVLYTTMYLGAYSCELTLDLEWTAIANVWKLVVFSSLRSQLVDESKEREVVYNFP